MLTENGYEKKSVILKFLWIIERSLYFISIGLLMCLFIRYAYIAFQPPYGYASLNAFLAEIQGIGAQPGVIEVILYIFILPLMVCLIPMFFSWILKYIITTKKK